MHKAIIKFASVFNSAWYRHFKSPISFTKRSVAWKKKQKCGWLAPVTSLQVPHNSTFSHVGCVFTEFSRYAILFVELVHEHTSLADVVNMKYCCTVLPPPHNVAKLLVQHCVVAETTAPLHHLHYCQTPISL